MNTTLKEYNLEFPADLKNIQLVEELIEKVREELDISDEVYGNILISVTEAVNNAILHGNEAQPDKKVRLSCTFNGKKLIFTVKDEGTGFDYENLPDPTDPANMEKLTGRGVFLMKQLSDILIFSDQGSTVELHFKI